MSCPLPAAARGLRSKSDSSPDQCHLLTRSIALSTISWVFFASDGEVRLSNCVSEPRCPGSVHTHAGLVFTSCIFLVFVSTEVFPKASAPPETLRGVVLPKGWNASWLIVHCIQEPTALSWPRDKRQMGLIPSGSPHPPGFPLH